MGFKQVYPCTVDPIRGLYCPSMWMRGRCLNEMVNHNLLLVFFFSGSPPTPHCARHQIAIIAAARVSQNALASQF